MLISADVEKIAAIIQQGGVVAYPTEAVFGLGCDPQNLAAVQRLINLKQRNINKGLIVIAADLAQIDPYMQRQSSASASVERSKLKKKLNSSQTHPTTWLIPASEQVPKWITGQYRSVAVRISRHPACQQLCLAVGHPIVSSSANPSGLDPARDIETVQTYFSPQPSDPDDRKSDYIDAIFSAPLGHYQHPSIIQDAISDQVLR